MAVAQPVAADKLNKATAPHSLLHRIIAADILAPIKSICVNVISSLPVVGIGFTDESQKSTLDVNGSVGAKLATITSADSPYTAGQSVHTIIANATSGAITVNLPSASTCTNRIYIVKKIDASSNAVTIDGSGSQTIDGQLTRVLTERYEYVKIQSDGSNWHIVG